MTTAPAPAVRSERAAEIVATARRILEHDGPDALTMRRLGDAVGMRAPSLYKHFPSKRHVEAALVEDAFAEMGATLHRAVERPGRRGPVAALLAAYRGMALANPNLYRLTTAPGPARDLLAPGLEAWSGEPFFLVTGQPYLAQALWAFAHGMTILEIDDRFMDDSDLDRTWRSGVRAFSRP
ncbi:MAG: TetR family transcriptional regulator [Intrasporangium sp.]|uniref:TetR/AcrR family transcriptional regulator n=1 Tax=Intrasporangium sp. TaxID=1925024 RepID=UPI002649E003|nr:TetR/AcrR family transcriptional regulator [Intrasporangium sp.]MDN5794863.1 TetR family transcriptional regulator [Intrasporangium sp.]